MTIITRTQLTLFVDPTDADTIERVRQEFNPIQFGLIKSHVTLCREDEIQKLEQVISNLLSLAHEEVVIEFGTATRFDNGKGLYLPAITENASYQALRKKVLFGVSDNPRKQEAHITLLHPRNSTCTDDIFEQVKKISFPTRLKFKRISLVQQEGGGPWRVLQEFKLGEKK